MDGYREYMLHHSAEHFTIGGDDIDDDLIPDSPHDWAQSAPTPLMRGLRGGRLLRRDVRRLPPDLLSVHFSDYQVRQMHPIHLRYMYTKT